MRTPWIGLLLLAPIGVGLNQCGSTRSNPATAWYPDDSIELEKRDAAAEAAAPAEPPVEPESSDGDAAARAGTPTPLQLEGPQDAGSEGERSLDSGPQPTGDVEVKKSGSAARAIRLWTDGRCRSQLLCPQPMDMHGAKYCGEPKPVACPQKLREAWRQRQVVR